MTSKLTNTREFFNFLKWKYLAYRVKNTLVVLRTSTYQLTRFGRKDFSVKTILDGGLNLTNVNKVRKNDIKMDHHRHDIELESGMDSCYLPLSTGWKQFEHWFSENSFVMIEGNLR